MADKDASKNIKDTDLEPVFLNGLPMQVWKNVMTAYCSKGSIILAAGAGDTCKAAMLLRQPCLALCLSEAHVKFLFDHLVEWMLTCMEDHPAFSTTRLTGNSKQVAQRIWYRRSRSPLPRRARASGAGARRRRENIRNERVPARKTGRHLRHQARIEIMSDRMHFSILPRSVIEMYMLFYKVAL